MCSRKVFQEKKLYNPNQLKFCSSISLNEKRIERCKFREVVSGRVKYLPQWKEDWKMFSGIGAGGILASELNEKRIESLLCPPFQAVLPRFYSMKRGLKGGRMWERILQKELRTQWKEDWKYDEAFERIVRDLGTQWKEDWKALFSRAKVGSDELELNEKRIER